MLKVLIADGTEEFCLMLSEMLQDKYQVCICHDGHKALDLLRSVQPDILVLDLMIPGYDGISLLQKAREERMQVLTLATTRLLNDYVTGCLEKLNVRYLMVKPCDMKAMTLRIDDLAAGLDSASVSAGDPRTVIYTALIELGIPTKLKGFSYIWDGVMRMSQDISQPMTKELYPAVAKLHDATAAQVERAIRSAIETAWLRRDMQIWNKYFQLGAGEAASKPTNAEFIIRLAHKILEKG